uniref:Putative RNA-binding protein n=1 Tax=Trypanosoma congolense (strain IL3000) TaxID=1068625 RepID=G0US39_TRYCI|nr:putative RNA-binding protein [Trypanosoma congolense IL3000]
MGFGGKKVLLKNKPTTRAAVGGAKSVVETSTVHAGKKPSSRPRITFEDDGVDDRSLSHKAAAAAAKRAAAGGIIEPKKRRRDEDDTKMFQESDDDSDSDQSELDSTGDDEGSLHSDDIVSDTSDDDDVRAKGKRGGPLGRTKREGKQLSYSALRLRFLPEEFQEPELYKFLSQFGANVLNCFCVRSRRTHQSKGIAYVQFDDESVLPTVVEECHGMALGGRCVHARVVTLHRAMPTRAKASQRRKLAYLYKTRGRPLERRDIHDNDPVGILMKCSRSEKRNNKHLRVLGIDYECNEFSDQLAKVSSHIAASKEVKKQSSQGGSGPKVNNREGASGGRSTRKAKGEEKKNNGNSVPYKEDHSTTALLPSKAVKPERNTPELDDSASVKVHKKTGRAKTNTKAMKAESVASVKKSSARVKRV